jgi:hypothetical protein
MNYDPKTRVLIMLSIIAIFALGVSASAFYRKRRTHCTWPWYAIVAHALIDATLSFAIALAAATFLGGIRIYTYSHTDYAYRALLTPAVGYVLIAAITMLGSIVFCWIQLYWPEVTARRWAAVAALVTGAVAFHFAFVRSGYGTYSLSRPPYDPWFAFIAEFHPKSGTAHMIWFAPRIADEAHGRTIYFLLGVIAPIMATTAALIVLLTGRRQLTSENVESTQT